MAAQIPASVREVFKLVNNCYRGFQKSKKQKPVQVIYYEGSGSWFDFGKEKGWYNPNIADRWLKWAPEPVFEETGNLYNTDDVYKVERVIKALAEFGWYSKADMQAALNLLHGKRGVKVANYHKEQIRRHLKELGLPEACVDDKLSKVTEIKSEEGKKL